MALKGPEDRAREHIANGTRTSDPEVAYHMTQMGQPFGLRKSENDAFAASATPSPPADFGFGGLIAIVVFVGLIALAIPFFGSMQAANQKSQAQEATHGRDLVAISAFPAEYMPRDGIEPTKYAAFKRTTLTADPSLSAAFESLEKEVGGLWKKNDACALFDAAVRLLSATGSFEIKPGKRSPAVAEYVGTVEWNLRAYLRACEGKPDA